jgi:hypothetical protein
MARITIELNTDDNPDDIRILRAVAAAFGASGDTDASIEAYRAAEEADNERPVRTNCDTFREAGPAAAPKSRRGKASAALATSPEPSTDSADAGSSATTDAGPREIVEQTPAPTTEPDGDAVTLPMINALLVKLLAPGTGHNAEKLTGIVKELTEGTAISPKHCDPKYWPAIYAAFQALG